MSERATVGKVILERGKYYLKAGDSKEELIPEAVGGVDALKAVEGQQVEVLYSEPQTFVVALRPKRRPPILCYLPAPWNRLVPGHEAIVATSQLGLRVKPTCYVPLDWVVRGVEEQVRRNLAAELLEQGIISKEVNEKISAG